MTVSSSNMTHPLYRSVIYDSECSDSLIYDKSRFLNEIKSIDEWIMISNDLMNVQEYETMLIKEKLKNKIIIMKFVNTTWISSTNVILVSATRLMKEDFDRDMYIKILRHKKTDQMMCDIETHHNLLIMKYVLMKQNEMMQANSI